MCGDSWIVCCYNASKWRYPLDYCRDPFFEDIGTGNRLFILFGCSMLGLAVSYRPCFFPLWPIFFRMVGWWRGLIAFIFFSASIFGSFYLGWSIDHLKTEWGYLVAGIMFLLSCLSALCLTDDEQYLALGVIMCLPGLWASNTAHHLILALPFFVMYEGKNKCLH